MHGPTTFAVHVQESFAFFHCRAGALSEKSRAKCFVQAQHFAPLSSGTACSFRMLCRPFVNKFSAKQQFYPISLPAIMSLSTVITERLSLSSIAASIIPCDSTPHILRGARLVTTATFLPTISSGL